MKSSSKVEEYASLKSDKRMKKERKNEHTSFGMACILMNENCLQVDRSVSKCT